MNNGKSLLLICGSVLLISILLISIFLLRAFQPGTSVAPQKQAATKPPADPPAPLSTPRLSTSPATQSYARTDTRNLFGPPSDPPTPSPHHHAALPTPTYAPKAPNPDPIYTGYATIDDRPYAVLEDSQLHDSTWLTVGDSYRGYTVEHIDPNAIRLRKGNQHHNILLADRFNSVPLAGDAPLAVQPDPGNLIQFRGKIGQQLNFQVTGSAAGSVWGSGVYTDDSALAAAAVHAGILANGQQGVVQVTILPGQDHYDGSFQNGVNSNSYANWDGSYRVSRGKNPAAQGAR